MGGVKLYPLLFCFLISFFISFFMFLKFLKEEFERKKVYFMWFLGFVFFGFCYIIDILIILGNENLKIVREMIRITGHTFLLMGLIFITGVSFQEKYIFPFIFLISGILLLMISDPQNIRFISSLYRGISMILISYNFNILRRKTLYLGVSLLTLYFLMAGIHDFDYFLLRPISWYFPYGFGLYGIFLFILLFGFFEMDAAKHFIINDKIFKTGLILGVSGIILNNFSAIFLKNLILAKNLVIGGIAISFLPFIIFLNKKELKNE